MAPKLNFVDALLAGLARDGGLYLPEHYPNLTKSQIADFAGQPYVDVAAEVIGKFTGNSFSPIELSEMLTKAYSGFRHAALAPLVQLDGNLFVLELFHGPTLAFKDVAMQLLGQMMDAALKARGQRATIVGATSGDTGAAAIEAFRGLEQVDVFILYPHGRVSDVQRRQMTTVAGDNIHTIALEGTFDDAQAIVKGMFNHHQFRDEMALSGVNSINWARIVAQTVYYFTSAVALGGPGRPISFSVPTGNFGDILAGYIAKRMGLPIDRLMIGTNANDILARTLHTGTYEVLGVHPTQSPSMDIQISSNFERLLFDSYDRDPEAIRGLMANLAQSRQFSLSPHALASIKSEFDAACIDEAATSEEMRRTYKDSGYLLDPHTAVGVGAARQVLAGDVATPVVVLGTAHPAKFPQAVKAATGIHPALPEHLADLFDRKEKFTVLANDQATIESFIRQRGSLILRPPKMSDYEAWSQLRYRSQAFLVPWEPSWPDDDLTRSSFRIRIRCNDQDRASGNAYSFFLFRRSDKALLGGLTLGNIRHNAAKTATLGYWMGEDFAGQGYMRQAVELALDFAFFKLGLHRVEAACLPRNARSTRLLQSLGFQREGLARAYLEINSQWEDHILFAILASDAPRRYQSQSPIFIPADLFAANKNIEAMAVFARHILRFIGAWLVLTLSVASVQAVEAVRVSPDVNAVDLTPAIERNSQQSESIQISTAPGADGIVRRIEVQSKEKGGHPNWMVFALTNDTDEQIDRLIVAPHFRLVDSGVIWPDLGATRISAITASQGFAPERQDSPDADVFLLTIDPGTTVTYIAELRTPLLPQVYMWDTDAYKDKITSLTLYHGIIIGIAGLLALFLTIVFVVKGAVIFPAAAALAWAVMAYVCIDFGFWHKIFGISDEADRIWRAATEATLAATLLIFLFAYLNLNRWHVRLSQIAFVWLLLLAGLIATAVYDAPVAAGVARMSLATIAVVGFLLVIYLATHGYERAIMLIPTWFLLLLWTTAAGFTVTGTLTNDLVSPALIGGLVLIVMLIGFTVMQNAFASGVLAMGSVSDQERKALALTGSGDIIFDWNVPSDRTFVSPEVEIQLGVKRGTLEGPASGWFDLLHPLDRDRYQAALDMMLEQRCGRVLQSFRLRASDGHYAWYELKARPVVGADGEVLRLIGTLTDVSLAKTAEERLLQDAVHDNLTGLPNRELFLDRLDAALSQGQREKNMRPTVITIDLDRFKQVNDAIGLAMGDSILLTLARRLGRLIKSQDTLARISGDQFSAVILSEQQTGRITELAEMMRKAISTPIALAEREVSITGSVGLALYDPQLHLKRDDMLKDAEMATAYAKRAGGNRVEIFLPDMRSQRSDRMSLEADLRRALERGEIKVYFQPIVKLEDRTVAGFEALLRWDHPRLGRLGPSEFISIAEETGLIIELGQFVLERTARELAAWQQALDVEPAIFASVNISSRQLLRHDLLMDVKTALTRSQVKKGSLKLELTESLVMENPEYATQILTRIESESDAVELTQLGSEFAQGFAFGQPMSAAETRKFLGAAPDQS
eukprot:gene9603-9680_t